jgi:acid phosphatase type 7
MMQHRPPILLRALLVSALAVACWMGFASAHAQADTQCTGTLTVPSPGGNPADSSVSMCLTTPWTQQVPGGPAPVISGDQQISLQLNWNPVVAQAGDVRGCAGQRLTPSGCVTWTVAPNATNANPVYLITHLYDTPMNSNTYPFTWHTECLPILTNPCNPKNGIVTLTANISLNGQVLQLPTVVDIENATVAPIPSPNAWNDGALPIFTQHTPFVIAATGDGAAGSLMAQQVNGMVQSWHPNMFMYLGDVYQRGSPEEFLNFYNPVFGQLASITAPTPGNHEYKIYKNASPYFWYWNYPDGPPPQPTGYGGQYYSFNAGGWHIISLDANILPANPADFMSTAQGQWLKQDLATHPNSQYKCTLAFWHQGRFSDDSLRLPGTSVFWNQLYAANADIIVNAHAHDYERWRPLNTAGQIDPLRGIREFIVGTGGNVLAAQWQTADSRSAFRTNTNWGALKLTLYPGFAHYAYYSPITTSGSNNASVPLDAGTIPCH